MLRPATQAAPCRRARATCRRLPTLQVQRHRLSVRVNSSHPEVELQGGDAASGAESINNSTAGEVPQVAESPLVKARALLQGDSVDAAALEAVLAEVESEVAHITEAVAEAESRADALEVSSASAKDQLLRLNADFENFRRRSAEEKAALSDHVRGEVVSSLLPVIDNFELARTNVKAETDAEQRINASYQGLYKQFVDYMRALGVDAVPGVGEPFDPTYHEAIAQEAIEDVADGTIVEEFRKGFTLGDTLLRPSMVKVASSGSSAGDDTA